MTSAAESDHSDPIDPIDQIEAPYESGWNIVASSVEGIGHLRTGMPCQDAHGFQVLPNGWLVATVADGAGSAERADVGSQTAVRIALEQLSRECSLIHDVSLNDSFLEPGSDAPMPEALRSLLGSVLEAVRAGLEDTAVQLDVAVRALATTLIVTIVSERWIAAVQVGDGAIVGLEEDGSVFAVTRLPDAEYANATTFICASNAIDTAQWAFHVKENGLAGVAVFSDGLQRLALKLPEGDPHPPFFLPLFRFVAGLSSTDATPEGKSAGTAQLEGFLRSPRITERADDDLTLLIATHFRRATMPADGQG